MGLFLLIAVLLTLYFSVRLHRVFSFVTLGVIGAAIYAVPGIIDLYFPFFALRSLLFYPTPTNADEMVLLFWGALFLGVLLLRPPAEIAAAPVETDQGTMFALAIACAVLGLVGYFYIAWNSSIFFFLAGRDEQSSSLITLLWRWSAVLGLLAGILLSNRWIVLFNLLFLLVIFMRGDRTMVVLVASAAMVALAYRRSSWVAILAPSRLIPVILASIIVFFGKTGWLTLKSGLSGNGWALPEYAWQDQALFQFEPLTTYAHIGHVMDLTLTIPPAEFLRSVLGNFLLFPSLFGVGTNLYNEVVTATLPASVRFGVAGNFIAHGWTVAGPIGVFLFGLILVGAWRLCDAQFARRDGATKLFWCCTGGILAFYAHRNGMDNVLSFVRQAAIMCLAAKLVSIPMSAVVPASLSLSQQRDEPA